jgi:hypothetical protein
MIVVMLVHIHTFVVGMIFGLVNTTRNTNFPFPLCTVQCTVYFKCCIVNDIKIIWRNAFVPSIFKIQ